MDNNAKKSKYKLRAYVIADEIRKQKKEFGNDVLFAQKAGVSQNTIYNILKAPENAMVRTVNKIRVNLEIDKEL